MLLTFQKRLLITSVSTILLLQGCSLLPSNVAGNYTQTFKAFSALIYGYEDYPITQSLVDQIPYASMRMKIGKGPAGLMILESVDREESRYTWVSADDVFITTQEGRIIRAQGLTNNLTGSFSSEPSFREILDNKYSQGEYSRYISLDNPEVYEMKLKVSYTKSKVEDVFILGQRKALLLIEERIENSYIRWKHTNKYWVDQKTGFVWQSIQEIAPNLPPILIQITKKPS